VCPGFLTGASAAQFTAWRSGKSLVNFALSPISILTAYLGHIELRGKYMNLFQAFVIGIIQGLTEFLPISSTAHIRVLPALFGWDDPGSAFTAVIQWGTLVAAVIYFRHDIYRLGKAVFDDLFFQRLCRTPDSTLAWMIVVGTIPVVVCGVAFQKYIKGELRSLYAIAWVAIVFALILWLAEWFARRTQAAGKPAHDLQQITWRDSIAIGFWQALALIPGASRSGVTITGGLFQGLTRESAARFSFLLSLPSVFGAGCYELYKDRKELLESNDSIVNLVVATIVSGIIGYWSIAFLLGYLKKHNTYVFIVYRLALGVLLLVLLQMHMVKAFGKSDSDSNHSSAKPIVKSVEE
jgi:undecaprenyl-diphosphatase